MKIITRLKYVFLPSALLLHISLILIRGYFLSTEFTLYPYLVTRGFLPYRDIIDQHFPTLLFGPFSLPAFLTVNPWPLLGLFLLILCVTDIFIYFSLIRYKVRQPLVWLTLFVASSVYFSGNILWIETFVNLLLSVWLFLSTSKKNLHRFVSGFILSQVILLRPTIAPAILLLLLGISDFSIYLFLGGLIGLAIPSLFIFKQGIFPDFFNLTITFNKTVYPLEARLVPGKREILALGLFIFPAVVAFVKNKKYLFLGILLLLFALAFPRFGYEHLQPLYLLTIVLTALVVKRPNVVVYLFIFIFFCLNIVSGIRHHYGNFFMTPEVISASKEIKDKPGQVIYLLGVPDIVYQLSGKMPPGYTYVPSLPWYLHQKEFSQKIIMSLEKSGSPVLIDDKAQIDGKNIVDESGEIIEYIRMNYINRGYIGNYQLYLPK